MVGIPQSSDSIGIRINSVHNKTQSSVQTIVYYVLQLYSVLQAFPLPWCSFSILPSPVVVNLGLPSVEKAAHLSQCT